MTTSRKSYLPAWILGRLAPGNVPMDVDYWEPTGAIKFTTRPIVTKPAPVEKAQQSAATPDWRLCSAR
jgi:hypothetical protein